MEVWGNGVRTFHTAERFHEIGVIMGELVLKKFEEPEQPFTKVQVPMSIHLIQTPCYENPVSRKTTIGPPPE